MFTISVGSLFYPAAVVFIPLAIWHFAGYFTGRY